MTYFRRTVMVMAMVLLLVGARDPFALPTPVVSKPQLSWYSLSHINANTLAKWLHQQKGLLPKSVMFGADAQGQRIWVQATGDGHRQFEAVLAKLDQPKTQILVQARIVRVHHDAERRYGVHWALHPVRQGGLVMNLPQASSDNSTVGFHLSHVLDGHTLDLELSALENSGGGEVIAKPKLLVSDGEKAVIESGQRIPYQQKVGSKSTAIHFEKAALSLEVIAKHLPGNEVSLVLTIHQDKPVYHGATRVPSIETQIIKTTVTAKSKQILVLGGIYDYQCQNLTRGVLGLSRLPFVGALFRHRSQQWQRSELMIFLQPTLLI